MKLNVNARAIEAAIKPWKFTLTDIVSIMPYFCVGEFKCCVIKLTGNKVVIISEGIILVYSSLENFLNGFDPLSLVNDDSIHYDQETPGLDFKILFEKNNSGTDEEFSKVYECMFGAREPIKELETTALPNAENSNDSNKN